MAVCQESYSSNFKTQIMGKEEEIFIGAVDEKRCTWRIIL